VIRILAAATISFIGAALGLIAAAVLLDGVTLHPAGFVVATAIYVGVELLTQPLLRQTAIKQAPAMLGSTALLASVVAFVLASVIASGLEVSGVQAWVLGPIIVWAVALSSAFLLPMVIFKKTLARRNQRV
jgi:putative membrane protein